jgi:hypothetical protein
MMLKSKEIFFWILLGIIFIIGAYHYVRHRSCIDMNKTNFINLLKESEVPEDPQAESEIVKTPLFLHQTYYQKKSIPQKIYDNIQKYASNFEHKIYDDDDIRTFLDKHFHPIVLEKFNSIKEGAHKADLFRYCIMYQLGGVYLDIKTELILDLEELIMQHGNRGEVITVIDKTQSAIYQGIIIAPPKQTIFLTLIDGILNSAKNPPYNLFIKDFYRYIQNDASIVKEGQLKGKRLNYTLFTEICSKNSQDCHDGLDRYGFCCNVFYKGKKIIKTRYADYPWK